MAPTGAGTPHLDIRTTHPISPTLSGGENIPALPARASLVSIVSHGKGGMPAFGKKLTRTEVRQLVAYVRRFKNQKSSN
jgi:mono/diheme cytochrome c family protein